MDKSNLTFPQLALWNVEQFYKGSNINIITGTIKINEKVNFHLFENSIKILIENSDIFNIKMDSSTLNVTQSFLPPTKFNIRTVSLESEDELISLQNSLASTSLDIANNEFYEFVIFKLPNDNGGVIGRFHHIICDAWSMSLVISKIISIYDNLINNKPATENILFPKYQNYISSEQDYINSTKFSKSKEFWLNKFLKDFNYSYITNNASKSCAAKRKTFLVPQDILDDLNAFCTNNKISLPLLFIACIGIYLAKINNSDSATIGLPILNRSNFNEKNTIGAFISTIPFKMDISRDISAISLISHLSKTYFEALRNSKYPYNQLLEDIRKETNVSKNLFDVAFSFQNARDNNKNSKIDYTTSWTFNNCVTNNLDIHVYDMDNSGSYSLFFDYRLDLFTENDINEIYNNLMYILKEIISTPDILLKDLKIVEPQVEDFILNNYNTTSAKIPSEASIINIIENQAKLTPDKLALSDKTHNLSYSQLINAVNNLAYYLKENGLNYQDKICLFFENSMELVVSILAALKLGVCYIPLNTNFPIERVKFIFKDSKSKRVLTNSKNKHLLDNLENIFTIDFDSLDINKNILLESNYIKSSDLAYIIYTSGSTGNPKGVQISNKSLINYIMWGAKKYVTNDPCNFALYSSIAFDLTVTSVYIPLVTGNIIYIYNNSNPELLFKEIVEDKKIHVLKLTPAHLTLLLDVAITNSCIKSLIVGGDILTTEICKDIINKFHNGMKIYNEYGPTEATVGCMIYEFHLFDEYPSVPIGTPINNTKIYILNSDMNLMPYNTIGEMYIGGFGLSTGYLNSDTANKKAFVKNPFGKGLLYKTGDLAKLHSNGIAEYIGRCDFQVKINGYRIEIGEIQSLITKYSGIKNCYVIDMTIKNKKELCVYYVASDNIDTNNLTSYLSKKLPTYMIPKHFIKVDSLPMTINGKIDRKALPLPNISSSKKYVAPKNELEDLLCNIYCKLLDLKKISTDANIFDYYMDSLSIIKAQTILYTHGYNVDTQDFYTYKTVQELSNYILSGVPSEKDNEEADEEINPNNINILDIQREVSLTKQYKNVLLFGATGFLGIHLLHELIYKTNYNIYCLVRKKDNTCAIERLKYKYKFYFPNEDFNEFSDRIIVLEGNLLDDLFGLSQQTYSDLINKIDICIHSAALVKHYGDYNLFHQTNVISTKRIIDFCITSNSVLHYISTMSVSGYGLVHTSCTTFTEKDFYIGQKYKENVYVRSKFEAEYSILKACKDHNLIASIYRIGNLSNRFSDGIFQENACDNSSLNRIIACIELNCFPSELANINLEFSPVDICARDIIYLINNQNQNVKIYHLFNNNYTTFKQFNETLKQNGIILDDVTIDTFKNKLLNSNSTYFGFYNFINNTFSAELTLTNSLTNNILNKAKMDWPKLTNDYLQKIIYFLKNKKLIGEKYEKN